jgi:hypothetical protein
MIRLSRLDEELRGLLPEVVGCALSFGQVDGFLSSSWHQRPEGWVRIDWPDLPNDATLAIAETAVQAHDGRPTPLEKIDAWQGNANRLIAALAVRASTTSWNALSAGEKAAVQGVIDEAGAMIVNLFRAA